MIQRSHSIIRFGLNKSTTSKEQSCSLITPILCCHVQRGFSIHILSLQFYFLNPSSPIKKKFHNLNLVVTGRNMKGCLQNSIVSFLAEECPAGGFFSPATDGLKQWRRRAMA